MHFFISLGYIGLLLGSFLAGSIVPFSSELLLTAGIASNANPWICLIICCIGNIAGGMTCYWLGHLGKLDWLVKHKIIREDQLARFLPKIERYGALFALLSWLPFAGEAISVCLGFLRVKTIPVLLYMSIGKTLRYFIFFVSTLGIIRLF